MLNGPSRSTGSGLSVTPQLYRQCPRVASSAARLSDRSASRTGFFFSWLLTELAEQRIPPRAGRSNPRGGEKAAGEIPRSKTLPSGEGNHSTSTQFLGSNTNLNLIRIVLRLLLAPESALDEPWVIGQMGCLDLNCSQWSPGPSLASSTSPHRP